MRRLLLPGALVVAVAALLIGWSTSRPAVPVHTPLGDPVELGFEVNGAEGDALEIGLRRGLEGRLFMQFTIKVEDGEAVAVLNGAGARSSMGARGRRPALPDWPFLKGRRGEPVLEFTFKNQLVELEGGEAAVRMVYAGAAVPLLTAVHLDRPTTLPVFVGRALGHDGPVRLEPGVYPVDAEAGVTIKARRLGQRDR